MPVAHGPATPVAATVSTGASDPVAGVLGPIFARLQVEAPEGDEFSGAALEIGRAHV